MSEVEQEQADATVTDPDQPKSRSRRELLAGAAGALGIVAIEALAKMTPAEAANGDAVTVGGTFTGTTGTQITNSTDSQATFYGLETGANGIGIRGVASGTSGSGVEGQGVSTGGIGVRALGISTGTYSTSTSAEGIYAQSGSTTSAYPGTTRNGVHGVTDSASDAGVWGEALGGGWGVAGVTNSTGTTNSGVWGANEGTGPGVRGSSGTTGAGSGIGVLAEAGAAGTALSVSGKAKFSRSGIASIAAKKKSAVVTGVPLTTASAILLTLQNNVAVNVHGAIPNVAGSKFTINLSAAVPAGKTAKVAWFIVN